jgi:Cupin domain
MPDSGDEDGTVTTGTLSVEVGGRRIDAGPGQSVQLPRGVPHRWWNQGDAPLAFEGHVRPAVDLDRHLQAVFEVMNAGPRNRPPLFYMAHVALRHRQTQTALVMRRPYRRSCSERRWCSAFFSGATEEVM